MKELDLIDKCHFFREKNTTCHIVCMYLSEEWEDCFLIEVNDGKEILAVTGTIEGRSYLSKFIAPNSSYEESKRNKEIKFPVEKNRFLFYIISNRHF